MMTRWLVMVGLMLSVWAPVALAEMEETAEAQPETAAAASEEVSVAEPVDAEVAAVEPATPEAAAVEPASLPAEEVLAAEPVPAPEQPAGLISVDFKDADIRQVLRIISLKSGVDVVASPDVEGLVTIKLTNVPWEQALDVILRTYGLAYERKGNIVRVMTLAGVEQETLATEVYPLSYAKAKEVSELMKEMLTDRGKVKYDERTNTVIAIDLPSNLFQLGEVVKRLDQPTPQVKIESKIVETKLTKDDHLGVGWSNKFGLAASGAVLPTTFPFVGGAEFGFLSSFVPRNTKATKGRVPETGADFTFGTIKPDGLTATLNFISSKADTNIISNPTIVTLNNREAYVQVGEEVNIPNFQIDSSTGKATVSGFQTKSTGVVLKVTPHVNQAREIVLDLKPEIIETNTTFDEFLTGVFLPRFTIQKADTQVRLNDGETLVIGGLVKRKKSVSHSKVPVLGDIPVLGYLFTDHQVKTDPQQDLLIFMTVNLVEEPPKAVAVAAQPSE